MRLVAIVVVVGILAFASVTYASEGIVSPLADAPTYYTETAVDPVSDRPHTPVAEPSLLEAMNRYLQSLPLVLSAADESTPPATRPSPTPTPAVRVARKPSMTITLLGDSMIDTLGPDGAGIGTLLKRTYPETEFTVINHGVGAENIDSGLRRLTAGYTYLGQSRNSVISERPDVIVVESFGYNPYPSSDRTEAVTRHWLKFAEIVDTIRRELPETKIVIAATIAPNWDTFGDGAPFINMSAEGKRQKTDEIRQYIESTISFAGSQRLPLADAYHPSLGSDKNGKLTYINAGDHIHYSDAGRALMANAVARAIIGSRLLE